MKQNITILLLISVLSLLACSQSPEDARKELGKMNIPYSESSFIETAHNGDIIAIKLFLLAGMNINASYSSSTALTEAVSNNRTEILDFLLDKGADPNVNGGQPLQEAASRGYIQIVQKLLAKGATLNSGVSLIFALNANHPEIAKLLLAKGIDDPNAAWNSSSALGAAIKVNNVDIVQELLRLGANPNAREPQYSNDSLLMIASQKGNKAIIDALLKSGANINEYYGYPGFPTSALSCAVRNKHFDAVKALLAAGADPNLGYIKEKTYDTILLMAIKNGLVDIAAALLEGKANPNAELLYSERTYLMDAIDSNSLPIIKMLLQHGANINAYNMHHYTALSRAVDSNKEDAVKLLIENGADVNASLPFNRTTLDYAYSFKRSPNIIKLLVDAGGQARYEKGSAVVTLENPFKYKASLDNAKSKETHPLQQNTNQQPIQAPPINPTTQISISPSFDCAKASTGSERLICSNANLATADVEMSKIYRQVINNTTDKKTLMREQNKWRKTNRDACKDVACVLNSYVVRTKQLNERNEQEE